MTPTKKQRLLALSVFFAGLLAGLLISGGIGGYFIWRIVNVLHLQQDLSAASEAQTVLLYMKRDLCKTLLNGWSDRKSEEYANDDQRTNGTA
jgi:hypothetical protein